MLWPGHRRGIVLGAGKGEGKGPIDHSALTVQLWAGHGGWRGRDGEQTKSQPRLRAERHTTIGEASGLTQAL